MVAHCRSGLTKRASPDFQTSGMTEPSARLRHDADIRLWRLPAVRILFLSVVVRHGAGDDHVLTAKHKVATPVNWKDGEDVIIAGSVSDDDAKKQYPKGWKAPKPYIRIVPQPR